MKTYIVDEVPVDLYEERKSKRFIINGYVEDFKRERKDEHFVVCDVGDIIEKYQRWIKMLPRVQLYYAVKCSMDIPMLTVLSELGASFDCASNMEIKKILDLGVSPNRIIYTHPHKAVSSLIYAERNCINLLVFDSETELHKIKSHHPAAKLILRIHLHDKFDAMHSFDNKFGCPSSQTKEMLMHAKELELSVVGVSFHVGSGVSDPRAYRAALKQSRNVIETGREFGFKMKLLDIGGGFPGSPNTSGLFCEIADVVNETIDEYFPPEEGVTIIAEPGRFVVSSAYTVVVDIIGKRWFPMKPTVKDAGKKIDTDSSEDNNNTVMYYVNDSVFGNFLVGRMYDPDCITYIPRLIKAVDKDMSYDSIIWGFTCTGKDCLNHSVQLPELDVGDWMYFDDMGAYTQSISSNFNGLETPEIKYYCTADLWFNVYQKKIKKDETHTLQ